MSTSILLAFLALSGATGFRPDARGLYAGCQAHEEGARGRFYACRDWNSAILELANTVFEEANQLELTRMALRTVLPGTHREERVMMNLGGQPRSVLRLLPSAASDGFGFAVAAAVPAGKGARLVSCVARKDTRADRERCSRALEYLATKGTPDGVDLSSPRWASKAAILDHELIVPEGCQLEEVDAHSGRLQCDSGMLAWTVMESRLIPSVERWLDETVATFAKQVGGGGWNEERLPCRLEGVATRCARLWRSDSGVPVETVAGTAVKRGTALLVLCMFRGETSPALPAVCNDTLALR